MDKPTADDLARFINDKLLKHNERIGMETIISDFLRNDERARNFIESIIPSYLKCGYSENETTAMFKKECPDLIKHAKQKLRNALKVYGYDFDTKGRQFRYPDNLTFDPMADGGAKQVKIDKSEIIYKYQKKLLKCLDLAIKKKQVVSFDYRPAYNGEVYRVILHPHYKREYNGRIFVFGDETIDTLSGAEGKYCGHFEQGSIAVDRIFSDEITILKGVECQEPSVDYNTYFDDIVGVTHKDDSTRQLVVIKTHNSYVHGLLFTKPIHKTQVETKEFDGISGEFSINVCYNNELLGALFHFEGNIEVLSPENVRKEMAKEAKRMYNLYNND